MTFRGSVAICMALLLGGCLRDPARSLPERLRADTSRAGAHLAPEIEANLYRGSRAGTRFRGRSAADFEVATRREHIGKHPCSACHQGGFVPDGNRHGSQMAHWGLSLHHADSGTMSCITCHAPENAMSLHTLSGDSVGWDHPYMVCAQCHARQAQDWAIGAHGKRLGGWAGPRVVQNCTGCHNPHDPAFPQKRPAIAPMASAPGREEGSR